MSIAATLAAEGTPAGGAPILQVFIAGALSLLVFVPLAIVVLRERKAVRAKQASTTVIGRIADRLAERSGLPRWLALPGLVQIASVLSAGIGVYWDVSWHVDLGRDEGPLANPGHYLIYFGLLGVFSAGVLSCGLARSPLPARTVRIGPGWRVPMGSVLITVAGAFALAGFPLDDLWHRLFGQDVTEWGPTHVLMIGGAVSAILGTALLVAEARQVGATGRGVRFAEHQVATIWLLGITVLLMEYELGIPQFPMVAQVVIAPIIATWAFVYARVKLGRGGALMVLAAYLGTRLLVMVVQGPVFGVTVASFMTYVGHAVAIELLALAVSPRRVYLFSALAGVLSGTVGSLTEWGWSHAFMPLPWPDQLVLRYVGYSVIAGVAAGLVVAWQLSRLADVESGQRRERRFARTHALGIVGILVIGAALALAIPKSAGPSVTGEITLTEAGSGADREVLVTVRLSDPDIADDAVWFYSTSWQGGGFVDTPMVRVSEGVYRTAQPVPVHGSWKTLIRLHLSDRFMVSLPIYMPADKAIPVEATPAESGVTRAFQSEHHLFQREAKRGLSDWMWTTGYSVMIVIYIGLLGSMAVLYTVAGNSSSRPKHAAAPPAKTTGPRPKVTT